MNTEFVTKISVIIPIFNVEKYLSCCLNSLCAQPMKELEIVCINDGSTDNSLTILKNFVLIDSRIKLINLPTNHGVSYARNLGIKNSSGEFLLFVDADDFICCNTCQTLYQIAKNDNTDIIVFGSNVLSTSATVPLWLSVATSPSAAKFNTFDASILFDENGCRPFLWQHFIRKELLVCNHIFLNEHLVLGEDNAFILTYMPYAKNITFLSQKFYNYRYERIGSTLSNYEFNIELKVIEHIKLTKYIVKEYKNRNFLRQLNLPLLSWITDFLFGDILTLSFHMQQTICKTLYPILWKANFLQLYPSLPLVLQNKISILLFCSSKIFRKINFYNKPNILIRLYRHLKLFGYKITLAKIANKFKKN